MGELITIGAPAPGGYWDCTIKVYSPSRLGLKFAKMQVPTLPHLST